MKDKQIGKKRKTGFTVVELAIVILIIATLTAISVPTLLAWLPNYKLKGAVRQLKGDFQNAKLEAIKRNTSVTIAFTPGAYNVIGKIGSYRIFVDTNSDSILDPGEVTISQVFMKDQISLITAPAAIRFNTRGIPAVPGTVTIRNERIFGQAVMNIAGRIRLERSSDGGATYAIWN